MFRCERGQAVPLLSVFVMLAMVIAMLMVRVGFAVEERVQAQNAADAAALAGVLDGEATARSVTVSNGGRLEQYLVIGRDVQVTVTFGSQRATARAAPGRPGFAES